MPVGMPLLLQASPCFVMWLFSVVMHLLLQASPCFVTQLIPVADQQDTLAKVVILVCTTISRVNLLEVAIVGIWLLSRL